jgi:hypothetical protein
MSKAKQEIGENTLHVNVHTHLRLPFFPMCVVGALRLFRFVVCVWQAVVSKGSKHFVSTNALVF